MLSEWANILEVELSFLSKERYQSRRKAFLPLANGGYRIWMQNISYIKEMPFVDGKQTAYIQLKCEKNIRVSKYESLSEIDKPRAGPIHVAQKPRAKNSCAKREQQSLNAAHTRAFDVSAANWNREHPGNQPASGGDGAAAHGVNWGKFRRAAQTHMRRHGDTPRHNTFLILLISRTRLT